MSKTKEFCASDAPEKKFNESFGYYVIPFNLRKNKYRRLKIHLNSLSSDNNFYSENRFERCRYVFSSIKDIYRDADFMLIDIEKIKAITEKGIFDRLFPLKAANCKERFAARLDEISAFIMDKSKGYLIFKINYGDLSLTQIECFSYYFRHIANSSKADSSFAQLACFILGIRNYKDFKTDNDDLTVVFPYISFKESYNCDLLQLICRKLPENRESHLVCLGRGYQSADAAADGYIEGSDHDIKFSSNKFSTWVGSPNTLTCVLENDNRFTRYTQNNIENDYLCLYLTLQNQRHTLLSMMTEMVNEKNNPHKLTKLQKTLNMFKLSESFKTVSNEYTYQNVYEQMYDVLDIEKLSEDLSDVTAHAAEQSQKNIQVLFGIFTVIASVETFYNIFIVLFPLISEAIKAETLPPDFFMQINVVVSCVVASLVLVLLCLAVPRIIKRK